jgi:hypothetical protein
LFYGFVRAIDALLGNASEKAYQEHDRKNQKQSTDNIGQHYWADHALKDFKGKAENDNR